METRTEARGLIWASVLEDAVPTPFAYVDLAALEGNIASIAAGAASRNLALRPHVKTHKLAAIARMQLAAGAAGLTVAKLSEAEAMVQAGVETSYMVAHPFWSHDLVERFVALSAGREVIACVDSVEACRRLSEAGQATARRLAVSLIVDAGYGRFGVRPELGAEIAQQIAAMPGLSLIGIRSHAGHAYGEPSRAARDAITAEEIATMTEVATTARSAGVEIPWVSIGSTPTAQSVLEAEDLGAVNEFRPGNYVFYDRQQLSLGVAEPDQCALTVVTTVVSTPREDAAIVDAGKLTLSSTADPLAPGFGLVLDRPEALLTDLSQECAKLILATPAAELGERLRVVPNHACEITNLEPVVYYGTDGRIEGSWRPEAGLHST